MITNMVLKMRYWMFAGLFAAIVGLSGTTDAQAQDYRYDRSRHGDGWTWYDGDYSASHHRYYRRGYDRGDRYDRRYYRNNYRDNYYRGNYYRGNGVRVGPVQVWW